MSLITVVAPIASWFAAGVAVLATALVTPTAIGIELLIRKLSEPSEDRPLSDEERASLERQNAILQERQRTVITIAENTLQSAARVNEERETLLEDQRDAASLLLDSTQEVTRAVTTLTTLSADTHERHTAFNTDMANQVTQLTESLQDVPASITLLYRELNEKQHMIDSLRIKIAAQQAKSAQREASLQQIANQVTELVQLNEEQAAAIEILQRQKTVLLDNIKALTEAIALLTSKPNEQVDGPAPVGAPTFFR